MMTWVFFHQGELSLLKLLQHWNMADIVPKAKIKSCLNRECAPAVGYFKMEERSNHPALTLQAPDRYYFKQSHGEMLI